MTLTDRDILCHMGGMVETGGGLREPWQDLPQAVSLHEVRLTAQDLERVRSPRRCVVHDVTHVWVDGPGYRGGRWYRVQIVTDEGEPVVMSCGCGLHYTLSQYRELPGMIREEEPGVRAEWRHCICGSTHIVLIDSTGEPLPCYPDEFAGSHR